VSDGWKHDGIAVRQVPVADVLDLRWRVLRPGRPRKSAGVDGDDDPTTIALAAWVDDIAEPISTATLVIQPCPWRPGVPARRLRAMATEGTVRGRGVGAVVLAEAIARARAGGAAVLWCHARVAAQSFYTRAGFTVTGEVFDVPLVGPHVQMALDLV
jgi:GNAT superfamily N-acetyltransferase